jgi:hypothetical protein
MSTEATSVTNTTEVHELINSLMKAVSAKNIDDVTACYDPTP